MITELSVKIFASVLAIFIGICSYKYFKMPEDNHIEQASEMIIKNNTGLDIDLSPESK